MGIMVALGFSSLAVEYQYLTACEYSSSITIWAETEIEVFFFIDRL